MPKVIVVGTQHISKESVENVKKAIFKEKPDCVAIELCPARYHALMLGEQRLDIKAGIVTYLLGHLQKSISKRLGILPGGEMLAAAESAKQIGAKIVLIDMDIRDIAKGINSISLKEKLKIIFGAFLPIGKKDIKSIDEKTAAEALRYMKRELPQMYRVLVADRNKFMAAWVKKLRKEYKKIVVVVGLGHKKDLERMLR